VIKKYVSTCLITCWLVLTVFKCYAEDRQAGITGKLLLSEEWDNKIYLSAIPSLDNMFTMSNTMIVSYANIQKDGSFSLDLSFLPAELALYRIHIAKKNSPPASLIIGGEDENHLFLILNQESKVVISKTQAHEPFHESAISRKDKALDLQSIDKVYRAMDSLSLKETQLKRLFIRRGIEQELRFIADTSSNIIVALYALNKSNYKANLELSNTFFESFLDKWKNNNSKYLREFKSNLPYYKEEQTSQWYLFSIGGLLIGVLLTMLFLNTRENKKIKSLSIQERKILEKLKDGKTNKEISEELNIGLSTVKTHVSSILSKLNLKSRKDILDSKF
jgi:DNA-binding CsgD family transcriptional regulator